MLKTKGNRVIYNGDVKTLVHGAYNPITKQYYNSSTKRWVQYPVKRIESKFYLYEFECFDYELCDNLFSDYDFNIERILKFIDLIYRRTIYIRSNDRYSNQIVDDHVRVFYREFENILGVNKVKYNNNLELTWEVILLILIENDIISYLPFGKSKYNANKKLWYIQLHNDFYESVKRYYKISDSRLVLHLKKQNKKIYKKYTSINKYELQCHRKLTLDISKEELKSLAELRYDSKKKDAIEMLDWGILSGKSTRSVKNKIRQKYIKNIPRNNKLYKTHKEEYIDGFIQEYEDYNNILRNLKNGVYLDDRFSKENYGWRYVNLTTNLNRHLRRYLKYDNQDLVTVDLRNSYISLFFSFLERLYTSIELGEDNNTFKYIYDRIKAEDGYDFYLQHKDFIFKRYYNEDDIDFYSYVGNKLGSSKNKLSRFFIKELVNRIINSNNVFMKDWKIGNKNINQIKEIIFTKSGVRLIDNIKSIDLNDIWEIDKRNYKKYKNLNILLVRYESMVMSMCMKHLIENNIPFVSVYDSFMVRNLDLEKVLHMLNYKVKELGKCLIFK